MRSRKPALSLQKGTCSFLVSARKRVPHTIALFAIVWESKDLSHQNEKGRENRALLLGNSLQLSRSSIPQSSLRLLH